MLSTISCRAWRRALPLVVVLLVVGLLPGVALAQDPAPGFTEGIWTDHEPGNTSNFSGEGTNRIYWGFPASGSGRSSYLFQGAALPSDPPPLNTSFVLGTFTHFNFPIYADNPLESATLSVGIDFVDPSWPDQTFAYVFEHEETRNQSGTCQYCGALPPGTTCIPCPDRVTFPTAYGEESFRIGDILYTLRIDGFRRQVSDPTVEYFVTQESQENVAYLYATISSVLVPEPAISIIKETSGDNATFGDGIYIGTGAPVYWRYSVQNTGNVALTGVTVTDDMGVTVTCPKTQLEPGESMTCTASGTAVAGSYSNIGTVVGTTPPGTNPATVSDTDPSSYVGVGGLAVSKTANATYTRTYTWTIDKSADGEYWKFVGDSATTHRYTVSVVRTEEDSGWAASGTITIVNTAPAAATITGVTDVVYDDIVANVTCPVTFPHMLAAGATLECTYNAPLPDASDRLNTTTVTTSGPVSGGTGTAEVIFGDPTTVVGYPAIQISDDNVDNGKPWEESGTDSISYTKDFSCPTDLSLYTDGVYTAPDHINTATIVETGQSDTATVKLHCYAPTVTKTAATSYDVDHRWTIDKAADGTYAKFIGDPATIHDYTVTVDQTVVESNFTVSGIITVANPNPQAAMTVALADSAGGTAATLDCGGTLTVPAGSSATCGYNASLAAKTDGTNTVTATLNGIPFTGTAAYAFAGATVNTTGYQSVGVTDSYSGNLGQATGDQSFQYSRAFTCPTDPSLYVDGVYVAPAYVNTATVTETGQSDTATVNLTCYAPVVTKTADTSFTRTYTWDIDKEYDRSYEGLIGDPAITHDYVVSVDQTVADTAFSVAGTITVANPHPTQAMTVSLTDSVGGTPATLDCGGTLEVPAGGTATCGYTAALGDTAPEPGTNTATATLNGIGFTGTAPYAVGEPTTVVGYAEINVTDTNGQSWTASGDDSWTYTKDFQCPADPTLYVGGFYTMPADTNTAAIVETEQSDTATVALTCYAPTVTKTAAGTYDETHDWTIEKTVSPEAQSGFIGDTLEYEWTVVVTEDVTEGNFAVTGEIVVSNPGTLPMIMTLSDVLDDGSPAAITGCTGGTWAAPNLTVAGGQAATCSYSAAPTGRTATENRATVTLNGIAFDATDPVEWTPNVINPIVTLDDDQNPIWPISTSRGGTWMYGGTYTCSTDKADYATDGTYSWSETNTATLEAGGTQLDSSAATAAIDCYVPTIAKTAAGTYDERHEWDIEKTVSPASQSGFIGDTLTYEWKVVVTEDTYEENFDVAGTITITNPNPEDAMTVALSDILGDGTTVTISACTGDADLTDGLTVAAGGSSVCDYSATDLALTAVGDAPVLNTATLTLNDIPFSADATIGWAPNIIRGSVELTDDQNPAFPLTISEGGTWTYQESYTCSTDTSLYAGDNTYTFSEDNLAALSEDETTIADDAATAAIACYVPAVSKTAAGTYTKTHTWDIEKTVNPASQSGSPTDVLDWTWTVTVSESSADSDFAVSGKITVANPNGEDALVVTLADTLSDTTVATISGCTGGTFAAGTLTVPASGTAVCDYSAAPTGLATNNVATATLNGIPFSGQATVNWTPTILNGTAALTDAQIGLDETLTAGEGPWTRTGDDSHTCALEASGLYAATGSYGDTLDNSAYVTGSDGQTASDTATTEYLCSIEADPKIDIEKATNGADADAAPGPYIPVGGTVNWTYVVTNTGNVDLTQVAVVDDQGVVVSCPKAALASGESMTCTAGGTAVAGQYANLGTVTALFAETNESVTDTDPSHYFGSAPAIDIEKSTNGADADTATGPYIPVGGAVTWSFLVTNTGNVTLTNLLVTDDKLGTICDVSPLLPGDSFSCLVAGTAVAGQYANVGNVTGTPPVGDSVTDSDPSHYFGVAAAIDIEKLTNGQDADAGTGPYIEVGGSVLWTYVVTNTSNVTLTSVAVTDDKGVAVSCPKTVLKPGESMTCTASGTAVAGQYSNIGTVTGTTPAQTTVTDSDPSRYFGSQPSISIEKATNGEDADTATGPYIPVGDPVNWTYVVTNTGNVDLTGVAVTDDQGVTVTCPATTLAVGASMTCTASGAAVAGQYANLGAVVGYSPIEQMVSDEDQSHYFGSAPAIDIEKATNGEDADSPTGPKIPVGGVVTWTYEVTNTGNVALSGVVVSDDQGVAVSCPKGELAVGESMVCTASGTAEAGQYANVGTVVGWYGQAQVSDSDPSHYFGTVGSLVVTKEVEWNRATPDPGKAFEICITGPSYGEGVCVLLRDGESHTWSDLIPGEYSVTESAIVGDTLDWTVEIVYDPIEASAARVVAEATAEVTVLNITDFEAPPTAVDLARWDATVGQGGVLHTWQTVAEKGVSGFRVYRGSSAAFAEAQLVGEIAAKGASAYQWEERGVAAGTWQYWLVEVDGTGAEVERFGPKAVTVGIGGQRNNQQRIYLPMTLLRG